MSGKPGRPKKDPNAANPMIDRLVSKALHRAEEPDCDLKIMLEVIKVSAAWEKVKHAIKESEEGEFFKIPSFEDDEDGDTDNA